MKKYCDYYITTKRHLKCERNNSTPVYEYSWHIRNKEGEELQSSFQNEEVLQTFVSKEVAEQEAKEAIQDFYPNWRKKEKKGEEMKTKCRHKKKNLPYLAWHAMAEKKTKAGEKQKQCPVCKLWFFKSEM